jgi:hypothetical protein
MERFLSGGSGSPSGGRSGLEIEAGSATGEGGERLGKLVKDLSLKMVGVLAPLAELLRLTVRSSGADTLLSKPSEAEAIFLYDCYRLWNDMGEVFEVVAG